MKRLIPALAGAVTLAGATFALATGPASAQGFSITIGDGGYMPAQYGWGPPPPPPPYYGPRRHFRGPPPPPYYGPPRRRCEWRVDRYWDGYGWVRERRRVCW